MGTDFLGKELHGLWHLQSSLLVFRIRTQLTRFGHLRNLFTIRAFHHAFFGKRRGTMSDQHVTLHFSNTQTTIIGTSLQRLVRQQRTRTRITLVDLVFDHLLQTHLEHGTHKDLGHDLFTGLTTLQDFISVGMEPHLSHQASRIRNALAHREWCGIRQGTLGDTQLVASALQKLTNGHTSRDGVRIHDEIRTDTLGGEREILFRNNGSDRTLLSVTRRKLVSESGSTTFRQPQTDTQQSIRGTEAIDGIHTTPLATLGHHTDIPLTLNGSFGIQFRGHKSNQDRLGGHLGSDLDNTVGIQLSLVHIRLPLDIRPLIRRQIGNLRMRLTSDIQDLLFLRLRMVVRGIKQTTLQRALIHEHRVLLVETTLDQNSDHHILTVRHAPKRMILHPRLSQRAARRTQNRCHGVKAFLEVRIVPSTRLLLLLSSREVVTSTGIVVRKGHDCSRRSQVVLGVNFGNTLGMLGRHGNHKSIRLLGINPVKQLFRRLPRLGTRQGLSCNPRTQHRTHRTTAVTPNGVGVIQAIPSQGHKSVNLARPTFFQ